ncbi:hypothetical protein SCP_0410360 [Sparassis crispa]|uniref:Uncharacterized protein n=1 Tax=Sparassis crispa TaxID=139825 RepID=A0A401GKF0_9APHY|nr:hypothetical protein SCP_0410360 [Sparassis crispa]GBE82651.1 hypothetical protein SCP_0410360 [Sparassis crispa]
MPAASRASKGSSRSVRISVPAPGGSSAAVPRASRVVSKIWKQKEITRSRLKMNEVVEIATAGLSGESLQLLSEIRGESSDLQGVAEDIGEPAIFKGNDSMDWETLPDDEEGSFVHAVHDIVSSRWKSWWYKDTRTWRQRLEHLQANWVPLMDDLTNTYLAW